MFGTGMPTKLRCIRYGIKKQGAYYIVKRPYGIIYHTKANELINAINYNEEHQYDALNVKGKQVVDIGADCGDTAIQFAYRGAREIYAYEPNLNAFKALELTLLNNRYNQIKGYNMAVLGKAQTIGINPEAKANRAGKIAEGNYQIKATTLNDIVKEHNITNGVLKMDCEGYEYDIIAGTSDKTLLAFTDLVIEYHNYPKDLPERFRKLGFKVNITNPDNWLGLMWVSR
jgi:FkbM family methyltransferase